MEQMEQLLPLPRNAKGHLYNLRRSEEIFRRKEVGVSEGHQISYFKAIMHQILFRMGLCLQSLLGELTALPRPIAGF